MIVAPSRSKRDGQISSVACVAEMNYQRAVKKLDALYRTLPRLECRGMCSESCGPIAMSAVERQRLVQISSRHRTSPVCPLLHDGRCQAYQERPLICRLWGIAEEMPCPFGCKPQRVITREEGFELLAKARAIGGESEMY